MNKITIILVEDHLIVRQGLRNLLNKEKDFIVIAEAKNGRDAVELASKLNPDVMIMDLAMPVLNGFEATTQIIKNVPNTKILILSAHNGKEYIEHVIGLGASGFILKQSSLNTLSKAIRAVYKGNLYYSPSILKRINIQRSQSFIKTGQSNKTKINLSSREKEVLQLISEGNSNKQIAVELKISIKTIEKHRQSLMDKLNIHNTAGLTRYAISNGIIENDTHGTSL